MRPIPAPAFSTTPVGTSRDLSPSLLENFPFEAFLPLGRFANRPYRFFASAHRIMISTPYVPANASVHENLP